MTMMVIMETSGLSMSDDQNFKNRLLDYYPFALGFTSLTSPDKTKR